jgi:glutaredoxin
VNIIGCCLMTKCLRAFHFSADFCPDCKTAKQTIFIVKSNLSSVLVSSINISKQVLYSVESTGRKAAALSRDKTNGLVIKQQPIDSYSRSRKSLCIFHNQNQEPCSLYAALGLFCCYIIRRRIGQFCIRFQCRSSFNF